MVKVQKAGQVAVVVEFGQKQCSGKYGSSKMSGESHRKMSRRSVAEALFKICELLFMKVRAQTTGKNTRVRCLRLKDKRASHHVIGSFGGESWGWGGVEESFTTANSRNDSTTEVRCQLCPPRLSQMFTIFVSMDSASAASRHKY